MGRLLALTALAALSGAVGALTVGVPAAARFRSCRTCTIAAGPMGDVAGYRVPPVYEQPAWWMGESYVLEEAEPAVEPPAAAVLHDACWWAPEECDLPLEPIGAAAHSDDDAYVRLAAGLPCITTGARHGQTRAGSVALSRARPAPVYAACLLARLRLGSRGHAGSR
jgi:hypothetical protein